MNIKENYNEGMNKIILTRSEEETNEINLQRMEGENFEKKKIHFLSNWIYRDTNQKPQTYMIGVCVNWYTNTVLQENKLRWDLNPSVYLDSVLYIDPRSLSILQSLGSYLFVEEIPV